MIKTLILDDDVPSVNYLTDSLSSFDGLDLILSAKTAEPAIRILNQQTIDLIFLGAQLGEMNGFKFLEKLNGANSPLVIYMSANEKDAIKAFEHRIFDFLSKPVHYERVEKSIKRVKEHLKITVTERHTRMAHSADPGGLAMNGKEKDILPIKVSGNIYFVEPPTIRYITAAGYYIEIFLKDKKLLVRETVENIVDRLPADDFIRIHRSHIINTDFLDAINTIGPGEAEAVMKDGKVLRISKTYKNALYKKMGL